MKIILIVLGVLLLNSPTSDINKIDEWVENYNRKKAAKIEEELNFITSSYILDSLSAIYLLNQIYDISERYGMIDEFRRLTRWVACESSFDSMAVSDSNAYGLTQIIRSTAEIIADSLRMEEYNLFETNCNLKMGIYWLSVLRRKHDGNLRYALAEYLGGENWKNLVYSNYVLNIYCY